MAATLSDRIAAAQAKAPKVEQPKRYPNFGLRDCTCRTLQVCKHGN